MCAVRASPCAPHMLAAARGGRGEWRRRAVGRGLPRMRGASVSGKRGEPGTAALWLGASSCRRRWCKPLDAARGGARHAPPWWRPWPHRPDGNVPTLSWGLPGVKSTSQPSPEIVWCCGVGIHRHPQHARAHVRLPAQANPRCGPGQAGRAGSTLQCLMVLQRVRLTSSSSSVMCDPAHPPPPLPPPVSASMRLER